MTNLSDRVETAVTKIEDSSDIAEQFADISNTTEFTTPNGQVKPIGLLQQEAEAAIQSMVAFNEETFVASTVYDGTQKVYFVDSGVAYTPVSYPYTTGTSVSSDVTAGTLMVLQGLTESDTGTLDNQVPKNSDLHDVLSRINVTATGTIAPRTLAGWASKQKLIYNYIAEAKADTKLNVGQSVKTLGYRSANDGGGDDYIVVAGGTGTDDGGSYHDMANGNQLKLVLKGKTNAAVFGLEYGSAIDQAAYNSLISYCKGNNSKCIVSGVFSDVSEQELLIPTHFSNLQETFEFIRDYFDFSTEKASVNIESGQTLTGGLLLTGGDFSRVTVNSSDATVVVDATFSDDAVMRVDNTNAPTWNIFVNCNSIANRGLYYTNNSKGLILSGKGVENTKERGLYVNDSEVHADFCKVLTTGQDGTAFGRALWVTRCATLVCESAEVSSVNPDTTIYLSRNSKVHAASITATSIGGTVLISAQRGSIYNGQTGTYSGSSSVMMNAIRGGKIVINDSSCTDIGARGLFADGAGASIHANDCTLTGAVGNTDNAIEAIQGGEVSAQSLVINGTFDAGAYADRLGRIELNIPTIAGMTSFGVRASNMGQIVATSGTISGSGINDLRVEHGSQICARSLTTTNGVGTPNIIDTNLSLGSFNAIDGVNGIIWN